MKTFKIYSSPGSYEKWGGGIGDIYIELENFAFPDSGWTDFGIDIIYWWMEAFMKLHAKVERRVKCSFMDGNFRFDVEITDKPEIWRIYLIKEYSDSEVVEDNGEINAEQATTTLLQIANTLTDVINKNEGDKALLNYKKRMQDLFQLMQSSK